MSYVPTHMDGLTAAIVQAVTDEWHVAGCSLLDGVYVTHGDRLVMILEPGHMGSGHPEHWLLARYVQEPGEGLKRQARHYTLSLATAIDLALGFFDLDPAAPTQDDLAVAQDTADATIVHLLGGK